MPVQTMFYVFRKIGLALDTLDLGGWLCLGSGILVICVTVLAPPWLDNQYLQHEHQSLVRQAELLQARRDNYLAFARSLEEDDPVLLQRLAWRHLRWAPQTTGQVVAEVTPPIETDLDIDLWMRPTADAVPPVPAVPQLPNTRLVRLIFGPSRPLVLIFGGWLIFMGLLLTPRAEAQTQADEEGETSDSPLESDA